MRPPGAGVYQIVGSVPRKSRLWQRPSSEMHTSHRLRLTKRQHSRIMYELPQGNSALHVAAVVREANRTSNQLVFRLLQVKKEDKPDDQGTEYTRSRWLTIAQANETFNPAFNTSAV